MGLPLAGALVIGATQSADAASTSALTLMHTAIQNAIRSGGVHENVALQQNGAVKIRMVNDIGTSEGRQRVKLVGVGTAQVIALDKRHQAYIRASQTAMTTYFGFPSTDASKYAGKWMKLTPFSTGYTNVVASTTLSSDFGNVTLTGHVSLGHVTRLHGRSVIPINGTIPASAGAPAGSATLYVSTSGKHLPVELKGSTGTETMIASWTHWGKKVHLRAPKGWVPIPTS